MLFLLIQEEEIQFACWVECFNLFRTPQLNVTEMDCSMRLNTIYVITTIHIDRSHARTHI